MRIQHTECICNLGCKVHFSISLATLVPHQSHVAWRSVEVITWYSFKLTSILMVECATPVENCHQVPLHYYMLKCALTNILEPSK